MSEQRIVKRTQTFSISLKEVAKFLGFDLECDPYECVWHNGYSESQLGNISLPGEFEGIEKHLPHEVCVALEDADRDAIALQLYKNRLEAIVDSLEQIDVAGEYTGLNEAGEHVDVNVPARVESAKIEVGTIKITIKNPEHLINDLINGEGAFYPHEILVDSAQDSEVQSRLHFLGKYFEIYGDNMSEPGDCSNVFPDDDLLKFHLDSRIRECLEESCAARAVADSDTPKEAAEAISKLTTFDKENLLKMAEEIVTEKFKNSLRKFA